MCEQMPHTPPEDGKSIVTCTAYWYDFPHVLDTKVGMYLDPGRIFSLAHHRTLPTTAVDSNSTKHKTVLFFFALEKSHSQT